LKTLCGRSAILPWNINTYSKIRASDVHLPYACKLCCTQKD